MIERIIDMIIITVGQWGQFGGSEYEQRFESLLGQLQEAADVSREQAIRMVFENVKGENAA